MKSNNIEYTADASTIYYSPNRVFSPDLGTYFLSQDSANQWWEIDFRREVIIDGYSILSGMSTDWINKLRNWNISVSIDSSNWFVVDFRQNTPVENNPVRFEFSSPVVCKYLHVTQTGPNSSGTNFLMFCYIEFFSPIFTLLPTSHCNQHLLSNYPTCSCSHKVPIFLLL